MSRIRTTAAQFGANDECRRRRRRRRFSGPSHDAQSKSHYSSGTSAHSPACTRTASGTATAAAMMVVLAVTILGATAPSVVSAGWIDPDTPQEAMTTLSLVDNTEYELVSRVSSRVYFEFFLVCGCLKMEECQTIPTACSESNLNALILSLD